MIKYLLLTIALLVATFFLGRCSAPNGSVVRLVDTVTVRRIDTLTRTDVRYRDRHLIRVDTLIHVVKGDTVFVSVPIDRYTFTDDTSYRAMVSGYNVSLDHLDIFRPTIERTITIREPARKRRFGLGLQVGYGIAIDPTNTGRMTSRPYIGIGLSYNFLTF